MIPKDMPQESMHTSETFLHIMQFLPIMEEEQEHTLFCNINWENPCNAPENGAWTRKRMNGGHS
jgi:hypothetical protein